jgi:poly-gamma-glutamate capsule biosynthesis protein CapA/YwtB (metallophosphatase superfamily)
MSIGEYFKRLFSQQLFLVTTVLVIAVWLVAGSAQSALIEDFESGAPVLNGYPGQDQDPASWQLTTSNAYGGGGSSLRLFGNTWKTQQVAAVSVSDSTVWQVAIYCENRGEMQALGVSDGTNELFYTFFGENLPAETNWFTVYQGAFPRYQWHLFLLPIGEDWQRRFGYLPDLNQLIYVNDSDGGPTGITLFDAIADVTVDRPRAPRARILYTVAAQQKVSAKLYRLAIDFRGEVFDPDSGSHTWSWDFGDSMTSSQQNPQHEFLVHADYPYTVGLRVFDELGLAGGDTCQIAVAPGDPGEPLTVNFVGDVFTGRGYETSGGLIATHGIEALFTPTLEIFGHAADLNVANLEVPYTDRGTPHPTKSVVFRSRPENISGIAYAGIDLVTLGNNHIIDYGEIGMLDTMDGLELLNIRYSGAGRSEYMALLPTFWTEKGVRLGFLGLCNRTGRQWNYQPYLDAGYDKPGFAYLLPENLDSSISYTRPLADVVIVQTHSGDEYETAPEAGLKGHASANWPPSVEAFGVEPGDPDFRFKTEPTPGERELRRTAIDLGADVLINHHPHVLQGFESYQGKLIAHSLGNFIFDLYYTETMPTLVLTLEIEKTGISGYRFTPAWINHWIPEPATGNLGREIVGRLADYSRPMNVVVVPLPDSNEARIHLSRADLDSTIHTTDVELTLAKDGDHAVSAPLALAGSGNLSHLNGLSGGGPWEFRWGREILWHGGFEDEGADLWDDNTADEVLVEDVAYSGARSLRLRRLSSATGQTGTDLEKHLPCDPTKEHSATAWLRTDNAAQARVMARFYDSRYSESPAGDFDLAPRFDGSTPWRLLWRDLETPSNALYFELRCAHEPPSAGTGYSWYDDLAFIEWEPWTPAGADLAVPTPNNFRYLQVRSADTGVATVVVSYAETAYGPGGISGVTHDAPEARRPGLRCYPNPFNPRVTIELRLSAATGAEVSVEVFDVRGRRLRTLHHGPLPAGLRHGLTWDGLDEKGRAVASGIYLVQAKAGQQRVQRKVTLVR